MGRSANMLRQILLGALLGGAICLPLCGAEAESRSAEAPSGSKRMVNAGPIQIDAITGKAEITMPLGPRVPGRIPLGITWHYRLAKYTYGSFKSFDWPVDLWADRRVSVTLNHRQVRFLRPSGALSSAQALAMLQSYGADGSNVLSRDVSQYRFAVDSARQSEDGSAWLVKSSWYPIVTRTKGVMNPDDPPPPPDPPEGTQTVIVQGGLVYYAPVGGTIVIKNQWGDQVQVSSTCDGQGNVTAQTITNAAGQWVQLSMSGANWLVLNNFGLIGVSGNFVGDGTGQLIQTISNSFQNPTSFGWSSIRPISYTASNGSSVVLTWDATGYDPTPEAYSSGDPSTGTGLDENGIPAGQWKGYEPVVNARGQYFIGVADQAVSSFTVNGGPGEPTYTTTFVRTIPQVSSYDPASKTIAWGSRDFSVTIRRTSDVGSQFTRLTFAQPIATGEYGAPGQSSASQRQMLLFTLGTIVKEEKGYGAGDAVVAQSISYEGFSLLNMLNPAGVVAGEVALQPVPTRIRTEAPRNDAPTVVREKTGWDGLTFTNLREVELPPGQGGSTQVSSAVLWRGAEIQNSAVVTGSVEKYGTSSVSWDGILLQPHPVSDSTSWGGSSYPSLRGATSANTGSKTYEYDSKGRLWRVTGTTGSYTSTTTTTFGNGPEVVDVVRSMSGTEPVGEVGESYSWNGPFRTGARQKPDPRWSSETRDALGRLKSVTSPDGITTRTAYDVVGRVESVTRDAVSGGASLTTTNTYSADERTLIQTVSGPDIATRKTRTVFDGAGRVVAVTTNYNTAAARTVFTQYDAFGRKILESLPSRKATYEAGDPATKWIYDDDGFLKGMVNARGFVTVYIKPLWTTFDGIEGFRTEIRTTKGTAITLTDLLGQVRRIQDASGVITRMSYDAFGRLASVERAGQVRSSSYNEVGWLLSQTQPEEGTTTYSRHTIAGTPLTTQKGGGVVSTYLNTSGDNVGLPSSIEASGAGSAVSRAFSYTNRRLSSMTENQGGGPIWESYGYDGLGRMISKYVSDVYYGFTISRTLNAVGDVIDLHYPQGGVKGDRISRSNLDECARPYVQKFGNMTSPDTVATMCYDAWNPDQDVLVYANNSATYFAHNNFNELSQVVHYKAGWGVVEDSSLTWSTDGFLTDRGSDHFEYDSLGRLILSQVTGPDGTRTQQNFAYDSWGNRNSTTSAALAGGLPTEAAIFALNFGSDNHIPGLTQNGASTGVDYDGLGRLKQINAIPGRDDSRTAWGYDSLGRVVSQGGAKTEWMESYLLDGAGLRYRRTKADGSREYMIYGFNREPLSRFLAPTSGGCVWKGDMIYGFGQLLMEDRPDGRVYQQGDQVGTPAIMTDANGNVIGRSKALPFGEKMPAWGSQSSRRFTNHEDGPQYPIYMQARMYLPTYGRFAQPDPVYDHSSDALNLYSYCSNNPVTKTDPDGMREIGGGGGSKPGIYDLSYAEVNEHGFIPGILESITLKGGGTGFFGSIRSNYISRDYGAAKEAKDGTQAGGGSGSIPVDKTSDGAVAQNPNSSISKTEQKKCGIDILGDDKYVEKVKSQLEYAKKSDPILEKMITKLEKSKNLHKIQKPDPGELNKNKVENIENASNGVGTGSTTKFDPNATLNANFDERNPVVALVHELSHASDADQGVRDIRINPNTGNRYNEDKAMYYENIMRIYTGDPQRKEY